MKEITAQQTREFSQLKLAKTSEDLNDIEVRITALRKRWDERNEMSRTLRELGGDIYYLDKEEALSPEIRGKIIKLRDEWHERLKVDKKTLKPIKNGFAGIVGDLFRFYKSLPSQKRRYFNEVDGSDIKKRFATLIMAFSFHHHMVLKGNYEAMKWIGFSYDRGWNYNGINYGS